VAGSWKRQDGEMVSGTEGSARIEVPYQPAEEYDFRICFTRLSGGGGVLQMLSSHGRSFAWEIAAFSGKYLGFHLISGMTCDENLTSVPMPRNLENGRRYVSLVEVRKEGAKAFLDGKYITEWETDYQDMDMPPVWKMRDPTLLGLGSSASPTVFHRVEVREVTGKGPFTRAAPAAR
jgi:hypothetical protein